MSPARRTETHALLVRSVEHAERDVIATFFTEKEGIVSAIVRGARKGTRRVGGAIEAFQTSRIVLEDRGGELATLKEGEIVTVRTRMVTDLAATVAAGEALRWTRHICPPKTPEPEVWSALIWFLDTLERLPGGGNIEAALAGVGLRILRGAGYALELERCARCGKECPADKPAHFDAGAGGIVCRACGGAPRTLSARLRRVTADLIEGKDVTLAPDEAADLVAIVRTAMRAHAGYSPTSSKKGR